MFICLLAARPQKAAAQQQAEIIEVTVDDMPRLPGVTPDFSTDRMQLSLKQTKEDPLLSIYAFPQSHTFSHPDWKRMWVNTAVLTGCFVSTLLVLECLP